ncbi:MAG TPA: aminoglycoside adenylyltransferase domain-containing protein [Bacillota bacterium]|nr:aminoglycoside adenylyltransferase domain-containing protein [Bacillota bacterium]
MLLRQSFSKSEINLTLELFLHMLHSILGVELVSVYLYGSIVFDDLAQGYGDFDFLVAVGADLSEENSGALLEMRKTLRNGQLGVYAHMLEGEFLPIPMLKRKVKGAAVYWGTKSEQKIAENQLGSFDLLLLKSKGLLIYGSDLHDKFEEVSQEELFVSINQSIATIRKYAIHTESIHSVDWLFLISRIILWLKENRLDSKSAAALWAYQYCRGEWKLYLPKAIEIRKNPSLGDEPSIKEWLKNLGDPIQGACDELEEELKLFLK